VSAPNQSERVPRSEPLIRRIFFPTDLSPESDRAFGHARLLAARLGAGVTLYHAIEIAPARWVRAAGREEELRHILATEARALLAARSSFLDGPRDIVIDEEVSAAPGLADISVLRTIHTLRPDLVVMATHSRGALGAFFLGSVAQEVLAHAGRPVLVVGPGCKAAPAGYRRIVVATDLSEASRRALPYAALLSSRFDAEVIAVHVVPRPLLTALSDDTRAVTATVPDTSTLRAFLGDLAPSGIQPRVEQGAPWERIVSVAREEHADLIVMATNGADSLGERLLGSQTERVIRRAPCPVLAV
jgi:nucleotide-binding universal stress UspA family protein